MLSCASIFPESTSPIENFYHRQQTSLNPIIIPFPSNKPPNRPIRIESFGGHAPRPETSFIYNPDDTGFRLDLGQYNTWFRQLFEQTRFSCWTKRLVMTTFFSSQPHSDWPAGVCGPLSAGSALFRFGNATKPEISWISRTIFCKSAKSTVSVCVLSSD